MLNRQLTLEDTPNDLQQGDLVLWGAKQQVTHMGVVFGFSKTRKTLLVIPFNIRLEGQWKVELSDLLKSPGNYCIQFSGMETKADKPFCRAIFGAWDTFSQDIVPYPVQMLPTFLQPKYQQIRQLLGV